MSILNTNLMFPCISKEKIYYGVKNMIKTVIANEHVGKT